MAQLLKQRHRLPTLVLKNEREPSMGMQTIFLLQVGDDIVERLAVPAEDLNIPKDLDALEQYEYSDPNYTIPQHVVEAIKTRVPGMMPPDSPLWLLFEKSPGFLPLVPWERLLQPQLGVPLLRVPNFLVNPQSDDTALDIVLCASLPQTEPAISVDQELMPIIRGLLSDLHHRVRLDIFTDVRLYSTLDARLADEGLRASLQLHDPHASTQKRTSRSEWTAAPAAAWLDWITSTLNGRSIDLGYFVAHGSLSSTCGLLLIADSPTRIQDREVFIGVAEIDAFLTGIGARAVGFSAPPQNYSGSGLRLLIEQLAWMRPGPVLLHDTALDPEGVALREALQFLFSNTRKAPASAALSLYCHPDYVRPEIASTYELQPTSPIVDMLSLGRPVLLSGAAQSKKATPGWLAKSHRTLEKSAAELNRVAEFEDAPSATHAGYENALRFVAGVLDQYADAPPSLPPGAAGGEEQMP